MFGFLAAFTGALLASAKDILNKRLSIVVSAGFSTFTSFACALPFYVVLLTLAYLTGGETFVTTQGFALFVMLRGLSDIAAERCKMEALAVGDLSFIACVLALAPVFLLGTSPLITGDPLTGNEVVGILVSLCGSFVLLVKKSLWRGLGTERRGILYAVASAFFFSLNSSLDRVAVQSASPLLSAAAMTLFSAMLLLPTSLKYFHAPSLEPKQWKLLWSRGGLEALFMLCKLTAMSFLAAPQVIAVQRIGLLFSIVGGKIVFRERDFLRRLCAGLLITAGALIVVLKPF